MFCSGGSKFPLVGTLAVTLTIAKKYKCKTIGTAESEGERLNVGLVRSGTTCGVGKVSHYYWKYYLVFKDSYVILDLH